MAMTIYTRATAPCKIVNDIFHLMMNTRILSLLDELHTSDSSQQLLAVVVHLLLANCQLVILLVAGFASWHTLGNAGFSAGYTWYTSLALDSNTIPLWNFHRRILISRGINPPNGLNPRKG